MAAIPTALLMEIAANPKVHDLFVSVYSRIFKDEGRVRKVAAAGVKPPTPEQEMLLERLSEIERRLDQMPSDAEMAVAFSALQIELRAGQRRLWYVIAALAFPNFGMLLLLYLR